MQFTAALLLSASAVIASPLVARQGDATGASIILADLNTTDSDLVKLNTTLNTFTAGNPQNTFTAIQIQLEASQIAKDLQKSINDTNAINGVFSTSDTLNIAQAIFNLEPSIQSVLNNIIVHKPQFVKGFLGFGDLSKTVEADLENQRTLVGEFGTALQPHAAPPYDTLAPQITEQIQALFDAGIAAYQNCTGPVCLPSLSFL